MGITIRGTATAVLLSATALGLVGGLSGCANHEVAAPPGAGESTSYGMPPSSTATTAPAGSTGTTTLPAHVGAVHNQADVTFLDSVVLLRQQGTQLATLGSTQATNPKLKTLAGTLAQEQSVPTDTLTSWRPQWNQPAPSVGTTQVSGLLSTAELSQLQTLTGATFDTKLVRDLVANHQAVLNAANTELTAGTSQQAKQVAQNLVTSEQADLGQLNGLGIG